MCLRRSRARARRGVVASLLMALLLLAALPALAGEGSVVHLDTNGSPMIPQAQTTPLPTPGGVNGAPTPVIEPAPGGGEMMRVPDRLRNNTVGRRGAGGDVSIECVRGQPATEPDGLRSGSE
jgi:hypothetical protein